MSMRDPIQKFQNQNGYQSSAGNYQANKASGGNNQSGHGKKSGKKTKYCWAWNKGSSCKFGERCDFINKCSYCDSAEHGLHVCPKPGVRHREKPMGKKD